MPPVHSLSYAQLPVHLRARLAGPFGVEILEDSFTVENDDVIRVTKLRLVRASDPASAAPVTMGIAAEIGARAWGDLRITVVDGHTLRITCGRTSIRRTYRDLGLHAENSREPTRKWAMLLALCAGHGTFRWRDFGEFRAVSQAMSVLRGKLKRAFGLEEDPFGEYANGWKARFFASSEVSEDV
jgi:hypothetical protein